jgi:ADP-ribosylglycohydrolase
MFTIAQLKALLESEMLEKHKQGYDVAALYEAYKKLPDSFDAVFDFEKQVRSAPMRADWPYVEPDSLEDIMDACDPDRALEPIAIIPRELVEGRIRAGFMASVCACMLGKPLEEAPYGTLWDIREAAQKVGQWPFQTYVSEEMLTAWGRRNPSWVETVSGRVQYVAPDDDITYAICGMLLLEKRGRDFTYADIAQLWIENLPIYTCWGPERTMLLKAGIQSMTPDIKTDPGTWADSFNPGQEYCGAVIRADAYGYACPGNPELAARLAWKDASFTHRKTGVYGTMFVAAAISLAFVASSPLEIFRKALDYVPQESRFFCQMKEALQIVEEAASFDSAYEKLHSRFADYGACRIIQELGTVMNTLRFAENVESGIGLQVAQGNDTDSFGCTCGAILGVYYGQELPKRWTDPLQNTLHTTMGGFHETDLRAVADRMAALPLRIKEK